MADAPSGITLKIDIEFVTEEKEFLHYDTYTITDDFEGFPSSILNLTFIYGNKRYGNWSYFVDKSNISQPISAAVGQDLTSLLWYNDTKGTYVTSLICENPIATPFLTYDGVKYLWSQLSLEDYPNNETLIAILNAIDETKADKTELDNLIEVELVDTLEEYTITFGSFASNGTNKSTSIIEGEPYYNAIAPGVAIGSFMIYITMGGTKVSSEYWSIENNILIINIPAVTGDIYISIDD